jgi:hypothetical protein
MSAKILHFPNRSNPTDDEMAVLIKASIRLRKSCMDNERASAIMVAVRE